MTVTIRAAEAEPAAPARAALRIGFAWLVLALLALAAVTLRLDAALPVFTGVWLVVPLSRWPDIAIRDASASGRSRRACSGSPSSPRVSRRHA